MSFKRCLGLAFAGTAAALVLSIAPASADKIAHPTAVFSGLDKITGRIISFEVATNETVQFGSLQITERACYTRPATEAPQTITFAQVDEIDAKKQYKRIFSGWMFASSPGLNGIEHPVYDVWLTDCKGGTTVTKSPPETASAEMPPPPGADDPGAADTEKAGAAKADTEKADAAKAAADQAKADRKRRRAEERAKRRAADAAQQQAQPDDAAPLDSPPAGAEPRAAGAQLLPRCRGRA